MFSVRNVMVPLDFSDPSMRALAYGKDIAQRFDASLHVVHIIPLSIPTLYAYPVPSSEWQATQEVEARKKMRTLVSKEETSRLRCRFIARCGHIDEELLRLIDQANIDLIVMGSHGRRAFEMWFLGSVTANMLRKVAIPVLTVTQSDQPPTFPFKKILATTDLSAASSRGVDIATALAQTFDSHLTVLHVVEAGREEPSSLSELIPSEIGGIKVDKQTLAGTPYDTIVRYAEENNFDLIVLTLQGKEFVSRALLGTTADRIIRSTHLPVFCVPHPGESPEKVTG